VRVPARPTREHVACFASTKVQELTQKALPSARTTVCCTCCRSREGACCSSCSAREGAQRGADHPPAGDIPATPPHTPVLALLALLAQKTGAHFACSTSCSARRTSSDGLRHSKCTSHPHPHPHYTHPQHASVLTPSHSPGLVTATEQGYERTRGGSSRSGGEGGGLGLLEGGGGGVGGGGAGGRASEGQEVYLLY
jgi:uncharacterized membrane protein YgcG